MKQEVSCTYQVTYIVSEYNQSKQDDAYYDVFHWLSGPKNIFERGILPLFCF